MQWYYPGTSASMTLRTHLIPHRFWSGVCGDYSVSHALHGASEKSLPKSSNGTTAKLLCFSKRGFSIRFFYFLIIIVCTTHWFCILISCMLCILHWRAKIMHDKIIFTIIKTPTMMRVVKYLSLNRFFVSISNFMIIFLRYKIVSSL